MPPAEKLYAENLALKAENEDLRAQVAWFRKQVFGGRSEKLPVDSPVQAKLGLPDTPRDPDKTQSVSYERRTPAPEKRPMPATVFAQLPVSEVIEIIPDEVKAEPAAYEQISEERTFEVDLIGPKLVKREIVRPKFRRKVDRAAAPVIAPALPRVAMGLCVGRTDRVCDHLQVSASPAAVSPRVDVGPVGRGAEPQDDGRLGADRRRLDRADLQTEARAVAARTVCPM
jgi:hypothetical protein